MTSGVIRRNPKKKGASLMSTVNPVAVITGKNLCLISRRKSVVRPMSRLRFSYRVGLRVGPSNCGVAYFDCGLPVMAAASVIHLAASSAAYPRRGSVETAI